LIIRGSYVSIFSFADRVENAKKEGGDSGRMPDIYNERKSIAGIFSSASKQHQGGLIMRKMIEWSYSKLPTILKNEKGQSMVEYALLLILIAVVVAAAVPGISGAVAGAYAAIGAALAPAGP
jgi:Flp pilus assembly pilin Flp